MGNDAVSEQALIDRALRCGATAAALTDVSAVRFDAAFRDACAQNRCGYYGKCWTCPPDVGAIDALMARAQQYTRVLVFQTVGQLEDSFDIEGMAAAATAHNAVTLAFAGTLGDLPGLLLGAGSCRVCERCTKPDGLPCRHPDRAIPSLESYGIAVSELAAACGLKYINGADTVTFFGALLF